MPNMAVTEPVPYFIAPNIGVCGGGIYLRKIPRGNIIFGAGEGRADRDAIRARPLRGTAEAARLTQRSCRGFRRPTSSAPGPA